MHIKFNNKLILVALLLSFATANAVPPPPLPQGGEGQAGPNQGQPQPPQSLSTNDSNVVKAARYAAQQMKVGRISSIIEAAKYGDPAEPIYTVKMETLDARGNDRIYQVDVCIPTDGKPMKLKSSQQIYNNN